MQVKDLRLKKALRTALLVLLLSAVGMGKMYAQSFTVGDLNYQVNNDGVSVTVTGHVNGTAATGSLTIPETVTFEGTDYSVTVIGSNAFYNCRGFSGSLTIPNSLVTIGEFAFHNCSGFMGSLVIPNSVATIGTLAFLDCVGFTSVTCFAETPPALGDSYYSYTGSCVFGGWSANTPIYIPCGCEESYASSSWVRDGFSDFVGMCGGTVTLVSIAEEYGTVTGGGLFGAGQTCTITATANEGYVFTKWTHDDRLVSLDSEYTFYVAGDMTFEAHFVPEGNIVFVDATVKSICTANWDTNEDGELSYSEAAAVTRLGQVFSNNVTITSFDELQFFTGLTLINMNSFYGCSGLSSITIPNTVTGIGTCAFASCSGLSSITIPAYVDRVGSMAFDGCSSLSSVYFEGNVAQWCRIDFIQGSNPLIQAHNLYIGHCIVTDLVIPEGVTEIKTDAFRGATCLTSLTLPNSVTTIGSIAFYNCTGLGGTLTLPNSVTTIGYSAFSGCSNLNEAIMLGVNPPIIGRNAFANSNFTIYVPYESLNDYKTTDNWSDYEGRIFPMAYTTIPGYGEGEGNYRFIASPLVDNIDPTTVDNMITETPYDLYRFHQSEDAEWQNYEFPENTPNFFLTNGQGYLYANAEDVNLIFKGEFNEDDTKEVELAYDANATFAGWNLVGNPFPVNAYLQDENDNPMPFFKMNDTGDALVAAQAGMPIKPCEGVFVFCPNDRQEHFAVFTTTAPANLGEIQDVPGVLLPIHDLLVNQDACGAVSSVTQTITLSQGWNWISTYIDLNEVDGIAMLEEALGDYGVTIQTYNESADYFGDGEWSGLEDYEWTNAEMVMVEVSEDCTIDIAGPTVDPGTVEIEIHPGWNWIGFPVATETAIGVAMAGFEAEEEDAIQSNVDGTSDYLGEWVGDVLTLVPGQGYMYYSNSTETKTLVFSTTAKGKSVFSRKRKE